MLSEMLNSAWKVIVPDAVTRSESDTSKWASVEVTEGFTLLADEVGW